MEMDSSNESILLPCTPPDIRKTHFYNSHQLFTVYVFSFILICAVILIGNGVVLWAFATSGKLRSRKYILIISLCLTDLVTGVVLVVQYILPPSLVDVLMISLLQISIFMNLAIAVERFYIFVIRAKNPSRRKPTSKQLIIFCVILWIGTLTVLFLCSIYPHYYMIFLYFGPWSIVITMICVSFLYISIFYNIHKMDRAKQRSLRRGSYKRTKVVVRAYAVIVVAFGLCWLPWSLETIRLGIDSYFDKNQNCFTATSPFFFLLNLGIINSAVNVFIYWRRLPEFRQAINNLPVFRCCECSKCCRSRPTEEKTNTGSSMHSSDLLG